MARGRGFRAGAAGLLAATVLTGLASGGPDPASPPAPLDLAGPFHTRSPWRLIATQGPATVDYGENPAPGPIRLCLEKAPAGPCISMPVLPPGEDGGADLDWGPHYLDAARPVYPRGRSAAPLLLIVTSSLHAGDGGQAVVTQLIKYDRVRDEFARVFLGRTGTNNNEEVRFVSEGPLRGDVISAEPTSDAPYVYWIEVSTLTPADGYKQVLRYRSATSYADGNRLAVTDSEMPNIERRLGFWRPGAPLPLPGGACPSPRLIETELWCGAP